MDFSAERSYMSDQKKKLLLQGGKKNEAGANNNKHTMRKLHCCKSSTAPLCSIAVFIRRDGIQKQRCIWFRQRLFSGSR